VSFGSAGSLIACSLLLDALPGPAGTEALRRLTALGDELAGNVCDTHVGRSLAAQEVDLLGAAHGWAGILYAVLRWHESSGWPLPTFVPERLEELARTAIPEGRGLRWPLRLGAPAADRTLAASWCNGAAGFVYLWTLAERLLGDEAYGVVAEQAAWTAWEAPDDAGDLCCGLAGRAYAALNVYKRAGDDAWRRRAHDLAERAALRTGRSALRRDSLYKGEIGVAVLAADLGRSEWSAMPLYEAEGCPRGGAEIRSAGSDRPAGRAGRRAAPATPPG
jgi:serine/threonine-protein kinase